MTVKYQLYTVTRVVTAHVVVLATDEQHAKTIAMCCDYSDRETLVETAEPLDEMPEGWTDQDKPYTSPHYRSKNYMTIAQHVALGHAPAYERAMRHRAESIEAMRRDMHGEDDDD